MQTIRSSSLAVAVLPAFLALTSLDALAQVARGELRGTVTDESGALVPDATVTATETSSGASRTTTTTSAGRYLMPALPVGVYEVRVEMSGFATLVRTGVRLSAGEGRTLDFAIKLSGVTEAVTVEAEAVLVDTEGSALQGGVSPEQVERLPLVGRNYVDLAALVPGARGNPGEVRAGAGTGDMNNYQVDGVDVTAQGIGTVSMSYSQEAVSEFQVMTNRFTAEYGRVAGAAVRVVTKSGTNEFHGSVFGFLRHDSLNAKDFVTGQVTPLKEKQFGASIGGPIVRDRAQFYLSYEQQESDNTIRPNTGIPQYDVDLDAGRSVKLGTARVDFQASPKHSLFTRVSIDRQDTLASGGGGRFTASASNDQFKRGHDVALGWTWVVNNRVVNEFSFGSPWIDNDLVPRTEGPRLNFPSAVLGTASNSPQFYDWRTLLLQNSLAWLVPDWAGEHKFRLGVMRGKGDIWGELPLIGKSFPQFNFASNPTDFNDPRTYPRPTAVTLSFGDFSRRAENPFYGAYVQDDWKLNTRLTLNLGVRYDVETGALNSDIENPFEPPADTDGNNFAPRIGFAYDPTGKGTTVIRGGAGRYFQRVLLNISTVGPESQKRFSFTLINPDFNDPLGGRTPEQIIAQAPPRNISYIASDYEIHRQDQLSIGVAQELNPRIALQADFVYSKGRSVPMSRRVNYFEDPAGGLPLDPTIHGRPYPTYGVVTRNESTGKSEYAGLQVAVNVRQSWLKASANYTLAWTKVSTDTDRFGAVNNPFNVEDEFARSTKDQRHRFVLAFMSSLPWDINLSGILLAGSDYPVDIQTNRDPFRLGYTGRWLDSTGAVLPKNGARTGQSDFKLDLRLSKAVQAGPVRFEGIVDVLNVLNTENFNAASYGNIFGTPRYLQPGASGLLFYQPRSVQLGLRVSH